MQHLQGGLHGGGAAAICSGLGTPNGYVALVDRLVNRAEIVVIEGDSYRLREAEEQQKARAVARKARKERPPR